MHIHICVNMSIQLYKYHSNLNKNRFVVISQNINAGIFPPIMSHSCCIGTTREMVLSPLKGVYISVCLWTQHFSGVKLRSKGWKSLKMIEVWARQPEARGVEIDCPTLLPRLVLMLSGVIPTRGFLFEYDLNQWHAEWKTRGFHLLFRDYFMTSC